MPEPEVPDMRDPSYCQETLSGTTQSADATAPTPAGADLAGRAVGGGPRVGVCSWSLRPRNAAHLAELVRQTGLAAVQLDLDPIRTGAMGLDEVREALGRVGAVVASGMMRMAGEDYSTLESIRRTGGVVPDGTWPENLAAARATAPIAAALGIDLVTFHAGFIPHDPGDPLRPVLLGRIRELAVVFAEHGVRVALETGQETADTLLELLAELEGAMPAGVPAPGVNFDPANMILYGMGDPIEALRRLAPRVLQLHVKDARPSPVPGEWGTEVRVGTGDVDWAAFFAVLRESGVTADLMIEREAGDDRVADIIAARDVVLRHLASAAAAAGGGDA